MRRDSLLNSFSTPIAAGLLVACINSRNDGFRQKDAKFYIELIVNWMSYGFVEAPNGFANIQISRILRDCVEQGLLKLKIVNGKPTYFSTRAGIIEFSTKLKESIISPKVEDFSFLIYFIQSYGKRVKEIILNDGKRLPPALLLEIDSILDVQMIIKERMRWIDLQILKLKERIDSSILSVVYANKLLGQGCSIKEVSKEIEKKWPYALNSVKSFSSAIGDLSEKYQRWELSEGGKLRAEVIWRGQLELLEVYRRQIFELSLMPQ